MHAAGLNGADMLQRRGAYPAPARLAARTSRDSSSPATSPALGPGAERFAEGDRVMAIVGGGGQAELCVVHERQAMPVPDGRRPASGRRARRRSSRPRTTRSSRRRACGWASACSISGAAGGVGTAAVQLAAAAGAHVTASVRDAALRDGVRALGARRRARPAETPRGRALRRAARARRRAGPRGEPPRRCDRLGRVVVIGVGAGFKAEVNLLAVMGQRLRHRRLDAARAAAGGEGCDRPRDGARGPAAVRPRRAAGAGRGDAIRSTPSREAYERFAAGGKLGKIVLELG